MTERYYCATAARRRGDPLAGSAAPARRWLLVEEAGPWATTALDSRSIPDPVADALHRAAVGVGGRALLIRRPGRRTRQAEQAWAVVDHDGRQQWGRWTAPDDLLEAARVMRAGPGAVGPTDGSAAQDTTSRALLLVCAHSLHDVCCAVRGRPVAAALALSWPDQTWECSHIGGDRFAANLLVLPDGFCYGWLDAASAVRVVQDHLGGRVDPEHLRGPGTEPPVVQAAIVAAHRQFGPAGPRDLAGTPPLRIGRDTWAVRLHGSGSMPTTIEAEVTRTTCPPSRLTCQATHEGKAYAYAVTAMAIVT
jgi:hypothetical protein